MNRSSEKDLSKQEDLTHDRLQKLVSIKGNTSDRPTDSLIEMIQWAKSFVKIISQQDDWVPYIHNKISIDGAFMQYCEESNLKVRAVHTDAITSWITDHEDEHFVGVGIFEIKDSYPPASGHIFYHCALFHKGNQNEDEVSFFVLVRKDDWLRYKTIRDGFDRWQKKRERESQEIEVIGGDPIPYDMDVNWDDVFLPDELRNQIIRSVEGFLNSKELYEKLKVPWRRGIGFWGVQGCHAKGTEILMYDGSIKNVEDVVVGDLLMGPDSQPRRVLKLVRGKEEMFRITPNKSDSFVVNKNHILHLRCRRPRPTVPKKLNITVGDFLTLTKNAQKNNYQMCLSDELEFGGDKKPLPLDPYFLGLWLGDGNSNNPAITTADSEIDDFVCKFADTFGYKIRRSKSVATAKCETLHISCVGVERRNKITNLLKDLGILNNKHIPKQYLTASVNDRLQLLAGIIDTDGSYSSVNWRHTDKLKKIGVGHRGQFDVIQKSKQLADDIVFLAKSLGLQSRIKSIDFTGDYYRIIIYGDISKIPTKLPRKQAIAGRPNKAPLIHAIKSIESVGEGEYYGFVIDKDHLYLTSDFYIHHNCGKTTVLRLLMAQYPQLKPVTIQPGHSSPDELLEEAFEYAEDHAPSLLFFEDLQELVKTIDIRHFLQLLDGMQQRAGILTIVTGNDFTSLENNLKSRPRRFDGFFEFPLPDLAQCKKYLTKYLADILPSNKIESLAKKAVKKKFTYSHLQEVYFNAVFIAIPEGREKPNEDDLNLSFKQVAEGKQTAEADEAYKRDLTDDVEYEYEEREDVL